MPSTGLAARWARRARSLRGIGELSQGELGYNRKPKGALSFPSRGDGSVLLCGQPLAARIVLRGTIQNRRISRRDAERQRNRRERSIVRRGRDWMSGVAASVRRGQAGNLTKTTPLEVGATPHLTSLLLRVSAGNPFVPRGTIQKRKISRRDAEGQRNTRARSVVPRGTV